ncbi:hypothetical protein L2D01_05325 [Hyphomonadaceae bacterium ML37]|nr:hypothetical protein L2D01_05325 [Hyphomonadaceae bacterium ML37]
MGLQAARKAADIVDDDDMRIALILFEKAQHALHARAIDEAARGIVRKNVDDLISAHRGIFAAARFLRLQPGSARGLLRVRHAAIDNSLLSSI